ncbi:LegC family aminotransferase [Hydrogenovibrio sp. 3SP14C1]|uniref:LegC family aminotransferase n=1 Tax=Hydrogenovibrio sp. 3SP14C1 TaxID=3038774 RepID=UPI00241671CB|nr:LegC family aminotransferase [Hydrogenovibrio sp. 3SP14C1]MDG4812939.1 LegC family aminotransferase [Hydrogenovibrio sp. 3SP14C1]
MSEMTSQSYDALLNFIRKHYETFSKEEGGIPLHAPCFDEAEKSTVVDCIDSTFVSSVGQYVEQFETDLASYTGASHAVAVVNGTMGLFLGLKVVGVEANDLVLTQSLTFVATPNAIKLCQADPLFLDVSRKTMGLSPEALQQFLATETHTHQGDCIHTQTGRRISACVPMHTLGFPCEIDRIVEICHQHHIKVVEDAAESLGSFYRNQHTGTFGDVGVFSFNGNKILTTGGGGMLVTNNSDLAQHAKHLSTTAKKPHAWYFEHDEVAYNLRMPNLNAALGVAQLGKINSFLKEKHELAQGYQEVIQKQPGLAVFSDDNNENIAQSNYWLNAIVCQNAAEREAFLALTNQQGIQTRPLWTPMHQLEIYQQAPRAELPNTEWFAERVVNLPSGIRCSGVKP